MIPEFAIMGHPNEGKSSVLSTLAEDDSVRVSTQPGETRECRTFPVAIDGEIISMGQITPGGTGGVGVLNFAGSLDIAQGGRNHICRRRFQANP